VAAPEARAAALDESVRRVGAIAVVHETLSLEPRADIGFDAVADRLAGLVGDLAGSGAGSAGPVARVRRSGAFGRLPAAVATPLAMVLTELMQNAVEHAFAPGAAGRVTIRPVWLDGGLCVDVDDDGAGFPPGFDPAASPRLGLQIARTLVQGELGGRLELLPRPGGGTRARIRLPPGATGGGAPNGSARWDGQPADAGAALAGADVQGEEDPEHGRGDEQQGQAGDQPDPPDSGPG
jgi:two-component sensor histidine kinase